jgi:ribosome-associated protein
VGDLPERVKDRALIWLIYNRCADRLTDFPVIGNSGKPLMPSDSGDVIDRSDGERFLFVTPNLRIPLDEFSFTFARSGGPGGQNVNKVNSKAVLRWRVLESPSLDERVRLRFVEQNRHRITEAGELVLTSQRFRDQPRNIDDCYDKLRELLGRAAVQPKRRRPTKPTAGSRRRRLNDKRSRSATKQLRRRPASD